MDDSTDRSNLGMDSISNGAGASSSSSYVTSASNTFSSSSSADIVWIYHERQQSLLCGQHALNNLAQCGPNEFTAPELAKLARELDEMELQFLMQSSADYHQRLMEGSQHVDVQGNFSIEVLKAAIQQRYGIVDMPLLSQKDLLLQQDITSFQGFLCHKSDHWFAIRNICGRYWNLNSTLERPVPISHFQLATEMNQFRFQQGYTIFCIPSGLPPGGVKMNAASKSSGDGCWHRMSDLLKGRSTPNHVDPWENVGSGMRLDGRASTTTATQSILSSVSSHYNNHNNHNNHINNTYSTNQRPLDELSEDDLLQLALQFSLEQTTQQGQPITTSQATTSSMTASNANGDSSHSSLSPEPISVPPEPPAGTPGSVRLQFKFPSTTHSTAKTITRRFLETDLVVVLYSYAQQVMLLHNNSNAYDINHRIQLRYGFPPKDLSNLLISSNQNVSLTIGEAKLANESITCQLL